MNKELRKLLKQYEEKRSEFEDVKETAELDELRDLSSTLKEMKERITILSEDREIVLDNVEERNVEIKANNVPEVRELTIEELEVEYEKTFVRALRKPIGVKLTRRDFEVYDRVLEVRDAPTVNPHFQSAVGEDGGFIIPKSVSTMIHEYKRGLEADLTKLVSVFKTNIPSGEFTYEKLSTITPFVNVSEWQNIPEIETPQFERKEYKISDYAGILPIPRQLLQDTDQNLLAYVAKYISKKTIVTRNKAVLDKLKEAVTNKVAVSTVDDVKDILDLKLDIAFRENAQLVTNQTGYNYLRKMKDKNGNYLLQPDVTQSDKYTLDGHTITVLPDRTLANTGKKAPFYVGDFEEAITFVDRGVYEITPTTIGGDSFKRNSYDIRIIDRFGVVSLDPEALVMGQIDTSVAPASPEA
ncbi:phage major capsid protein [Eremococcus coleocola]|uniref:phage major capsid protein n=1 Tax=Eremococcus coleocola TaxID=88132 RepID=UPI00040CCCA6|nr:phage major capsid protein [Eremococcus coleocola]